MKRSGLLTVIRNTVWTTTVIAVAFLGACGDDAGSSEAVADRSQDTAAGGNGTIPIAETSARPGEQAVARNRDEPVLMPTAPADASSGAMAGDGVVSSPSGFADGRELWRQRLPGTPQPLPDRLTEEIVDACLAVANDIDGELGLQLASLRRRSPAQLETTLRKTTRLYDLALLRQRDSSLYRLKLIELNVDREIHRLLREYRDAKAAGELTAEIEKRLRGQLIPQIAFRYRNREQFLCDLRDLVNELELELVAELAYLEEFPNAVVEERLRELLAKYEPPPPE